MDEIRYSGRRIVASEEVGRTHGGDQLGQAIGDEVPTELYEAVAKVLSFVYRLDKERRGVRS